MKQLAHLGTVVRAAARTLARRTTVAWSRVRARAAAQPRPDAARLTVIAVLAVGVTLVGFAGLRLSSGTGATVSGSSASPAPSPTAVLPSPSPTATAAAPAPVELTPVLLPSGVSVPVPDTWTSTPATGADLAYTFPASPAAPSGGFSPDRPIPASALPADPVVTITDLGAMASVYNQDILDLVSHALGNTGEQAATPVVDDNGIATFTSSGEHTVEARVLVYAGRGLLITLTLDRLDPAASAQVADWVTGLATL